MSEPAISVRDLGKKFMIGAVRRERYVTLRESLTRAATAPVRRAVKLLKGQATGAAELDEVIWALRHISFDVAEGNVVGIIGQNGAGKSTLLKVLTRITEPTEGYADIRGRVGSLLEVGTGFHAELTGRENVYLNGAILGMTRSRIDSVFDEIVDFAETEKFIDTPVKHYSSGMTVRLAFAVAAYMEPEILLIDEVLAVGDIRFQKKCLGRISEVAGQGRTILFVSHNMATVENLCERSILLEQGRIVMDGPTREVIDRYLVGLTELSEAPLAERTDRRGDGAVRATAIQFLDADENPLERAFSGRPLRLRVHYACRGSTVIPDGRVVLVVVKEDWPLFSLASELTPTLLELSGEGYVDFVVPELPLSGGEYHLNAVIARHGTIHDSVKSATTLVVEDADFFGVGSTSIPGHQGRSVLVRHDCEQGRVQPADRSNTGAIL